MPSLEIIDLRRLGPDDLEPLLQEEAAAWKENLHWDYTATTAMIRRFLEGRALTGYAAVENGRAAGFSFYVCEGSKGLIGDVYICRSHRQGDTAGRVLTHVLETLEATPGVCRIEAQLLHVDSPAVRELFAAHGFTCYERVFLHLALAGLARRELTPPPGFEIRGWEPTRFLDTANLITRSYEGHVDSQVSDQYRTQAGALRFLDNIIHYPGCGEFYPAASYLVQATASPAPPCGLILTSVVSAGVGHITQLCVSPEWQRSGIGRSLLERALGTLAQRGFHAVTLTATLANRSAMELYHSAGFTELMRFPAFALEMPARHLGQPEASTAIGL